MIKSKVLQIILNCLEENRRIYISYDSYNKAIKGKIKSFSFDGNELDLHLLGEKEHHLHLELTKISDMAMINTCLMTYKEYDARVTHMIKKITFKPSVPSLFDIQYYIQKEPEKYLDFLIFLSETIIPVTEEEKNSMKQIRKILYENMQLV